MGEPLEIAYKLFEVFEQAGIKHCHWKSNQHLDDALAGRTDLDLLVARSHAVLCEEVLGSLGYKRLVSQPWARYPGIEDWIGFDERTGKLAHVHLHYQLLSGRRFVKEQHLPWEDLILETAVKDPRFRVFMADPSLEVVLLMIRIALKTRTLDLMAAILGRRFLPKNIKDEFIYLQERIDEETVQRYAIDLLGDEQGEKVSTAVSQGLVERPDAMLHVKSAINQAIGKYRRQSRVETAVLYRLRLWRLLFAKVRRRLGLFTQTGKCLHTGGAVVAVIGSDGTGKSTLSEELRRWLSWKVDAHRLYLGSGDGSVGWTTRGLKHLASMLVGKKRAKRVTYAAVSKNSPPKPLYKELGAGLLALSVANGRYEKLLRAKRVQANGGISICDRYPQDQFMGIYDGPRLQSGKYRSRIGKYFAQREATKYELMAQMSPDIVIRLHVPTEVALDRKPDHKVENIREKGEITHKLDFARSKVVDIDASRPIEEVIRSVKRAVWESL